MEKVKGGREAGPETEHRVRGGESVPGRDKVQHEGRDSGGGGGGGGKGREEDLSAVCGDRHSCCVVHDGTIVFHPSGALAWLHTHGIAGAHAHGQPEAPERQLACSSPLGVAPRGGQQGLAPVKRDCALLEFDAKFQSIHCGVECQHKVAFLTLHLVAVVLCQEEPNLRSARKEPWVSCVAVPVDVRLYWQLVQTSLFTLPGHPMPAPSQPHRTSRDNSLPCSLRPCLTCEMVKRERERERERERD